MALAHLRQETSLEGWAPLQQHVVAINRKPLTVRGGVDTRQRADVAQILNDELVAISRDIYPFLTSGVVAI